MSTVTRKVGAPGLDHYDYYLPDALIAQNPLNERTASRLLHLQGGSGGLDDLRFLDILDLLQSGDVLVFNDTKVIPARLHGRKLSGGRVEFLVERILDPHTVLAQAGSSKPVRPGQQVRLEKGGACVGADIVGRQGDLVVVRFAEGAVDRVLGEFGHVPLPPYIRRPPDELDRDRYQNVFARRPGAVAAPTAGLHFDAAFIETLKLKGVACVFLTLHVGAGTFQPVRVRDPGQHRLHSEQVWVPGPVCEAINTARSGGNKVVAVGTTCVRALETAAHSGRIEPYAGETDLFIAPGYQFRAVDAIITNFHLPKSSLLMLVCAFAGTASTLNAYRHAVRSGYRFYSYGDAMFVTPQEGTRGC